MKKPELIEKEIEELKKQLKDSIEVLLVAT